MYMSRFWPTNWVATTLFLSLPWRIWYITLALLRCHIKAQHPIPLFNLNNLNARWNIHQGQFSDGGIGWPAMPVAPAATCDELQMTTANIHSTWYLLLYSMSWLERVLTACYFSILVSRCLQTVLCEKINFFFYFKCQRIGKICKGREQWLVENLQV